VACAEIGLLQLAVIQSRFAAAATHAANARSLLPSVGDDEATQLHWLHALVLAAEGDLPGGLACATSALRLARAAGLSEQEPECLRVLGILHARNREYLEAEMLFHEAIDLCRQRNDPYRQGLALIELGRLYEGLSESDVAGATRSHALAAYCYAGELLGRLGAAYDLGVAQAAEVHVRGELRQRTSDCSLWISRRLVCLDNLPEKERAMIMG